MARADLLKKLFRSYRSRDDHGFAEAAQEVIEEERRKHHVTVANELERIMRNGTALHREPRGLNGFDPPPRDSERRTSLLEVRHPERQLDDLVLDDQLRQSIQRVMEEYREWEVLEANGLAPTQRALFCGPSGCGKTATAEAVATELALPLLYVRFDSVVSSLLGETAANLRKVFDYAARGQWVVLFDEFDAIGRSRDDATEHGEIKRVVNSFLQIMDSFMGRSLVIAATNFEASLDPAVWRRFDEVLRFGKPNTNQIKCLVQRRLKPLSFDTAVVNKIASGLKAASFADAERVCLDIRKQAAIRGKSVVAAQDVEDALATQRYRRQILEQATTLDSPTVDRE
ncbi:MAG: ATP-binding protein [Planctomycetales bacterium]|nr:ATP-binding protein [Planctomycetales bacterium]